MIHLSSNLKYRVHANCVPTSTMAHRPWFVLPPVQEFYFKSRNLSYKSLPPFAPGCEVSTSVAEMEMLYPKENARIYIPRELDGQPGSAVLELAHRTPSSIVYWHLDGNYVGTTKNTHHFAIQSLPGKHVLTIIDDKGESLERHFEIISKM